MMDKDLRKKILQFNKARKVESEKASDMDIIVAEIMKLPPGQLKKVLTSPVLQVLEKYGYEGGS